MYACLMPTMCILFIVMCYEHVSGTWGLTEANGVNHLAGVVLSQKATQGYAYVTVRIRGMGG